MNAKIVGRIKRLRKAMNEKGMSAYLINGCDPHLGEYIPDHWKTREFISGFTGSFGWLAITLDEVALWTDSRYYIQAKNELKGTGIQMLKARLPETIYVGDWVAQRLQPGSKVGLDGTCYSLTECQNLERSFEEKNIHIENRFDLLNEIWNDRPAIPSSPIFLQPVEWAGVSRSEKFRKIAEQITNSNADITIITALDDLCWTFNIRGSDIDFSPVTVAFGMVTSDAQAYLFVDINKIPANIYSELMEEGVSIYHYNRFYSHLVAINNHRVLIDPDRTNYSIVKSLSRKNSFVFGMSVPALMKSRKNNVEIEGMKMAAISDGVALLDFQLWLEKNIGKKKITEYDVLKKLTRFRSYMPGYICDSFYSIVGYNDHGAIVHLHVKEEEANLLKKEGVLLVDSGGHYRYGTTDITRTFVLGPVSDECRKDFTLVLKGMIGLSAISFPKGTLGCHLDILARRAMWMNHINYGHGTSHGVGSTLYVHEGPQSIRPDLNNQPILPGNVLSNEPALYREGLYGLRTENMMVCVEDTVNEYGEFYRFETLTMYPIDPLLLDLSLLEKWEIEWIDRYHAAVFEKLSPLVTSMQLQLLERLTKPLLHD